MVSKSDVVIKQFREWGVYEAVVVQLAEDRTAMRAQAPKTKRERTKHEESWRSSVQGEEGEKEEYDCQLEYEEEQREKREKEQQEGENQGECRPRERRLRRRSLFALLKRPILQKHPTTSKTQVLPNKRRLVQRQKLHEKKKKSLMQRTDR